MSDYLDDLLSSPVKAKDVKMQSKAKVYGDKWAGLLNSSDFDSPEIKKSKKIEDLKENKSKNISKGRPKQGKSNFEREAKNLSKDSWMNDLNISDLSLNNSIKIRDEIEKMMESGDSFELTTSEDINQAIERFEKMLGTDASNVDSFKKIKEMQGSSGGFSDINDREILSKSNNSNNTSDEQYNNHEEEKLDYRSNAEYSTNPSENESDEDKFLNQ